MLNRKVLIEKVAKIAYQNEQRYGGCSQCVVGAFKEVFSFKISDEVFRAASGLAGGIGLKGSTCGSLTGGVIVLSSFFGREYHNFADPEGKRFTAFRLTSALVERFRKEYGSEICYDIQKIVMGRSYNLWDAKERRCFFDAGGHDDKCPTVCSNAAKWVMEILLNEDFLKEESKDILKTL